VVPDAHGSGTDRYRTRCKATKTTAECTIQNGEDEFTLRFRSQRRRWKLVELRGRIVN
jgi:hypothetical protein